MGMYHGRTHWWELRHWIGHQPRVESAVFYMATGILLWLCFKWIVDRFTDGLFPNERKLNREVRERSERYRAFKKEEEERETKGLLSADGI